MTHSATPFDASRDIKLLARIRRGDDNAFNELVNAYAERLYRFAYMRSRDSLLAEDAVHTEPDFAELIEILSNREN